MTDKTLEEQTKKREGRAKPLTTKQIDLLNDIYYTKHLTFGRDKLFKYLQLNHPEEKISRRSIATWLLKQENHQIHRRAKTQKDVRATVSRKPYQVIQIDLGNLQNFEINGFQYFMVGVDMFTRMVFLRAMKDRTEGEINRAFQSIHKEVKTEMKTLRADNEFTSSSFKKYAKDNNIRIVYGAPSNPTSQAFAERFVGLTKRVISSATLNDETFNWVKNMNKIAEAFNDTISKSTGYSPNQIEKFYNDGDTEKISEIYQEQVNIKSKTNKLAKQEFFEGDKVRIFTAQENDLYPQRKWSLDLYTIEKVFKPKKEYSNYTYKLEGGQMRCLRVPNEFLRRTSKKLENNYLVCVYILKANGVFIVLVFLSKKYQD